MSVGWDHKVAGDLAEFFCRQLPGRAETAWEHSFCSAWQMGCMLLDEMGYATETDWGAVPVSEPRLPDVLPRRDDCCVAFMKLGSQNGLIEYYGPESTALFGIRPAHGLYGATPDPEFRALLIRLGLIRNGAWTVDAVPVLWRDWPYEWPDVDFSESPDLVVAARQAVISIPAYTREDLDRALSWDNLDIRRYLTEGVVHRSWRYPEGWLPKMPGEPAALEIFHDPLSSWIAQHVFDAISEWRR